MGGVEIDTLELIIQRLQCFKSFDFIATKLVLNDRSDGQNVKVLGPITASNSLMNNNSDTQL